MKLDLLDGERAGHFNIFCVGTILRLHLFVWFGSAFAQRTLGSIFDLGDSSFDDCAADYLGVGCSGNRICHLVLTCTFASASHAISIAAIIVVYGCDLG